ncbi:MAG: hypothetical protein IT374_16480 [Polyangiaceae bacterium]|nr:hypothetical protein [Polyangiaceae bacterium]
MRSFGVMLLVVGLGSFAMKHLGVQFILVSVFPPEHQTAAAIGLAVLGAALIGADVVRARARR